VGVRLIITPQITEGDYVKMDVYQEISIVETTDPLLLVSVGPTTRKRSTESTVLVKDGKTVVIGGLFEDRIEESVVKIPFLGDIPILGWLFKSKSETMEKRNLLVFITPHIIRGDGELEEIKDQKIDLYEEREQKLKD
jgi:general secretion pathway protein D